MQADKYLKKFSKEKCKGLHLEEVSPGWRLAGREKISKRSGDPGTLEAEQGSRGCSCRAKSSSHPGLQ